MADRIIEVVDDRQTGETILDEALKMMKMQQEVEKLSINSWVDLLSGKFSFWFYLNAQLNSLSSSPSLAFFFQGKHGTL